MAGLTPKTADEINHNVGTILRRFVDDKESVGHLKESLAPIIMTEPPYTMTAEEETLIKSAVNDLDTALDAIDMTFINQLVGLW